MPEIFGVSWGMYAIIGGLVVILLLLVVLVIAQKRKKGGAGKAAPAKPLTRAEKTAAKRAEIAQHQAAAAAAQQQAPEAAGYPGAAPQATPASPDAMYSAQPQTPVVAAAPAPSLSSMPAQHLAPSNDPLQDLVSELLHGWGDITQEDTNRLAIFRPELAIGAVMNTEIPRELKGNDQARARLAQLRRWATGYEHSLREQQAEKPAQNEYAGMVAPQPLEAAPEAVAQAPAPAAPATPVAQAPVAPQAPAAAPAPMASEPAPPAPMQETPPAPTPSQIPEAPLAQQTPPAAQPAAPVVGMPPAQPTATFAALGGALAAADTVAASPAATAPEMPAQTPAAPAATPATPAAPAPAADDDATIADVTRSTEAAVAAAAAAFWAKTDQDATLTQEQPPVVTEEELPVLPAYEPVAGTPGFAPLQSAATGASPDTYMSDLRSGATTGRALLAKPRQEQLEGLAFLQPAELSTVLDESKDVQVKMAAIDQLESIGSAAALDVIYHSLYDSDPRLQARALAAADRILGAK